MNKDEIQGKAEALKGQANCPWYKSPPLTS